MSGGRCHSHKEGRDLPGEAVNSSLVLWWGHCRGRPCRLVQCFQTVGFCDVCDEMGQQCEFSRTLSWQKKKKANKLYETIEEMKAEAAQCESEQKCRKLLWLEKKLGQLSTERLQTWSGFFSQRKGMEGRPKWGGMLIWDCDTLRAVSEEKFAKSFTPGGREDEKMDRGERRQRTEISNKGSPKGVQSGLPVAMHHGYYIVVVCFGLKSERPFIIQGD